MVILSTVQLGLYFKTFREDIDEAELCSDADVDDDDEAAADDDGHKCNANTHMWQETARLSSQRRRQSGRSAGQSAFKHICNFL